MASTLLYGPTVFPIFDGFRISLATTTTLAASPGFCTAKNIQDQYANFLTWDSELILDSAALGAGGLDTGVFANDTWYEIYLIGNSNSTFTDTGLSNQISLVAKVKNTTALVMPQGYDLKRFLGCMKSGTAVWVPGTWSNGSATRTFNYSDAIQVLNAGASATYAEVDLSGAVPSVDAMFDFTWSYLPANVTNTFALRTFGSVSTTGSIVRKLPAQALGTFGDRMQSGDDDGVPKIEYKVTSSDALTINVVSYDFNA